MVYEDDYNDPYTENIETTSSDGKKHSPAKAAIAQSKPRDNKGHFLSGVELQAHNQNVQAQQQAAERARINSILGNRNTPSQIMPPAQVNSLRRPIVPNTPNMPQSNFAAILNANSPQRFSQGNINPSLNNNISNINGSMNGTSKFDSIINANIPGRRNKI